MLYLTVNLLEIGSIIITLVEAWMTHSHQKPSEFLFFFHAVSFSKFKSPTWIVKPLILIFSHIHHVRFFWTQEWHEDKKFSSCITFLGALLEAAKSLGPPFRWSTSFGFGWVFSPTCPLAKPMKIPWNNTEPTFFPWVKKWINTKMTKHTQKHHWCHRFANKHIPSRSW